MMERDTQKIDERVAKEKKDLLEALAQTSGIVSSACKACNISRMTYYRYYNEDPEFKEKADDVKELQKDLLIMEQFLVWVQQSGESGHSGD